MLSVSEATEEKQLDGAVGVDWRVEIEKARHLALSYPPEEGYIRMRKIGASLPTRLARVNFAAEAVDFDTEASRWVQKGDGDVTLNDSEFAYMSCLQLYPYNASVAFKFARALYLQDKLFDAEANFRNALALGVSAQSVRPYLSAIAGRLGIPLIEAPQSKAFPSLTDPIHSLSTPRGDAFLYPDLTTIRALFRLFVNSLEPDTLSIVEAQRSSRTAVDLLAHIILTEDFRAANLDLVYVISDPDGLANLAR
jgi:hypothetical protein